jgi:POT family proton-dependent oligopeptide transporter
MIVNECSDDNMRAKAISIQYLLANLGTFSIIITPIILHNYTYKIAFLSPTIAMFIATIVFILGLKKYKKQTLISEKFSLKFITGFFIKEKFILTCIMAFFYVFLSQIYSSWVVQAGQMQHNIFGFKIQGAQMQVLDTIIVVTFIPLLKLIIFPFLIKKNFTLTSYNKLQFGMWMATLAFLIIVTIEWFLKTGSIINIAWQVLPYLCIGVAEVFIICFGFEVLYRGISSSQANGAAVMYYFTCAFFSFIFSIFCSIFSTISVGFFVICCVLLFAMSIFLSSGKLKSFVK